MTDAPNTIWAGRWPHGGRYWREKKPELRQMTAKQYTLTSTVAAQLKAADELAEAITNEREMVCQDMGLQAQVSKRLEDALTAYRKVKDAAQ